MADEKRILVVGDVMEDHYVRVETSRRAPEADIPVWDEVDRTWTPGGAWNVAENIASLMPEAMVYLAGIVDSTNVAGVKSHISAYSTRAVVEGMKKTRYVSANKIIFRSDNFRRFHEDDVREFEDGLIRNLLLNENVRFDAVVFSDYDKGTVTKQVVQNCRRLTNLVVVDSKRKDLSLFWKDLEPRRTILKVNEFEWGAQAGNEVPVEAYFDQTVVTKGKDGAVIRQFDRNESQYNRYVVHSEEFPTRRAWSVDVTGCGDTHTAALTVSMVKESDLRQAVRFANEKASQVVQIFGTAIAT